MEKAKNLLRTFYQISGMRVGLYDRHARGIAFSGPTTYSFCNAVHATQEGFNRCFTSDENAFLTVKKSKKTYVFTCPYGLFEAIVPILSGDELLGYLFVGESILKGEAQRSLARCEGKRFIGDGCSEEQLNELIGALAAHDAPTLEAYVGVLELFAREIADTGIFTESGQNVASLTKDYLHRNYTKRLTLSELALRFHCSTVTLTEHFKKAYGTSIMAYVTALRMKEAVALLRDTQLPVGAIATRCGYTGIEHFSKVFKKAYGQSPLHWRDSRSE